MLDLRFRSLPHSAPPDARREMSILQVQNGGLVLAGRQALVGLHDIPYLYLIPTFIVPTSETPCLPILTYPLVIFNILLIHSRPPACRTLCMTRSTSIRALSRPESVLLS